jgi:predicted RNase H-like HicB family nuclease
MASDNKYSIEMMWSEADGAYLAQVRELPGCIADGATAEEAFESIRVVMQEWLETAKEEGREIPAAITFDKLAQNAQAAQSVLEQQIENRVREVVGQILQNMAEQQSGQNIPSWHERGSARVERKLEKSR